VVVLVLAALFILLAVAVVLVVQQLQRVLEALDLREVVVVQIKMVDLMVELAEQVALDMQVQA
jgi:hypothetical protein